MREEIVAMKCEKLQSFLPDLVLDPARVPPHVREHLKQCAICGSELATLQATMRLLDEWAAPEPTPYFDVRLAAGLREQKQAPAPGMWERVATRLQFGSNLHWRPVAAGALALLLVAGAGSYAGFESLHPSVSPQQTASATVKDLELLDRNAQTIQQLAAFDMDSDGGTGAKVVFP